jgi:uncharacterized membrane protein
MNNEYIITDEQQGRERTGPPWENKEQLGFFTAIWETLRGLLFIFTAIFVGYAFITIVFRTRRIRLQVTEKWEDVFLKIAFILVIVINWIYLIIVKRET